MVEQAVATQIRDLRAPGTIDPGDVLTGPVRTIGRWRLGADETSSFGTPGTETTLFVLDGSGTGETGTVSVPLQNGTSLTLPLGSSLSVLAGADGLELVGVVLDVVLPPGAVA